MKYEYLVLLYWDIDNDALQQSLNYLGQARWSLVSVIPTGDNSCRLFLQREIIEQKKEEQP